MARRGLEAALHTAQAPKSCGGPKHAICVKARRVSGFFWGERGEEERLGTDLDEQETPKLGGCLAYFVPSYRVPARRSGRLCFSVRVVEVGGKPRGRRGRRTISYHASRGGAEGPTVPVAGRGAWPFNTSLLSGCLVPPSDNALAESKL